MTTGFEHRSAHLERLDLANHARAYVDSTRSSQPSRRASSSGKRNTVWRFASRKMGCAISCESNLEYEFVSCAEGDPDILEFWDQPPQVSLTVATSQGSRRTHYTPDFLVVFKDRVQIIEVKPITACRELHIKNDRRWMFEGDQPVDAAARDHFRAIGLEHLVVTNENINSVRAANCRLLATASQSPAQRGLARLAGRAISHLEKLQVCSLHDLLAHLGLEDSAPVLRLIGEGIIASDLSYFRLSDRRRAYVSSKPEHIQAFRDTQALVPIPRSSSLIPTLTPREAIAVKERLAELAGDHSPSVSSRTLRRWRRAMRLAKAPPLGLVPRVRHRGNRTPRLTEAESQLIADVLCNHYMTPLAPHVAASYREYLLRHDEAVETGLLPPSSRPATRPTFDKSLRLLDQEAVGRSRGGTRQGHACARPTSPEKRAISPDRPFERVHIDHYLCDLHVVVSSEDRIETRRPWLSGARDQATGALLAMWLSFRDPSIRSCHGVLRDLVRRHGRLPESIVVDNGSDFESTYFEGLLARYGVSKQSRPPGAPRFGAQIESSFLSVKAQLTGAPGNTGNDSRARNVSSSHKAQKHANLSPIETYALLERFCFEHFNGHPLSGAARSPGSLLREGLTQHSCSGVPIPNDLEWLAASAIPLRRRLKYDQLRGVRHLGKWYFSPLLSRATPESQLEAFIEPWDANVVYVQIRGDRVACRHGAEIDHQLHFDVGTMIEATLNEELADLRSKLSAKRARSSARIARTALERKPSVKAKATIERKSELLPERDSRPMPYPHRPRNGR